MELSVALISAAATLGAAAIAFRASQNRNEIIKMLAKTDDKRILTTAELDDISVRVSAAEQLGASPPASASVGVLQVKLIYPGDPRFRSYSREISSNATHHHNYSPIEVHMDGEQIGSGSGESGFQLNFSAPVGRHTLVYSWSGTVEYDRYNYRDEYRGSTVDKSGRVENIVWFVRGGKCAIHLHSDFSIDHAEPAIALTTCYKCKMPGFRVCKCGVKFCAQHASIWRQRLMCLECKQKIVNIQFKVAAVLGGLGVLGILLYWLSYYPIIATLVGVVALVGAVASGIRYYRRRMFKQREAS